jgi:hypothetical protein
MFDQSSKWKFEFTGQNKILELYFPQWILKIWIYKSE